MTQEVQRRAIEPFFTTRTSDGGTGLGLSIVYGFIKQTGGNLEITSEEGIGTSVRICLPIASEEAVVAATPRSAAALVVDDDPQTKEAVTGLLNDLGYSTKGCSTGEEALHPARCRAI